jgi:hypothetical protein
MYNDITTLMASSYIGYISRATCRISVLRDLPHVSDWDVVLFGYRENDRKFKTEKKSSLIPNDGNIDK